MSPQQGLDGLYASLPTQGHIMRSKWPGCRARESLPSLTSPTWPRMAGEPVAFPDEVNARKKRCPLLSDQETCARKIHPLVLCVQDPGLGLHL